MINLEALKREHEVLKECVSMKVRPLDKIFVVDFAFPDNKRISVKIGDEEELNDRLKELEYVQIT